MRTIVGTAAMAAVSILISSSLAPVCASASPTAGVRHPWAKVVVNHPASKHGAYYKGVSQTPIAISNDSKRDEGSPAPR
ncbi:hypothetical protein MZK49_09410 [Ensifer sesbaniae]|uniref:hypothetical protein n=1 Tax=Ensifer sesbaniae TaxID=1214071 RepID=UPI001567E525|nr:hypothetical protein [Ensifer sesbaniae]MCK3776954.1 hypothetical protein [Ensifer sesbaniae]NRQ17051.1 hypothetical protein [Ensifer sesbaniae]